jgi:hypothetical protein
MIRAGLLGVRANEGRCWRDRLWFRVDDAIPFLYDCLGPVSMVIYPGYKIQGSRDRIQAIDDILKIFLGESTILKVCLIDLIEKMRLIKQIESRGLHVLLN